MHKIPDLVTRVPPQRLGNTARPASAQQPQRAAQVKKPKGSEKLEKPVKTKSGEEAGETAMPSEAPAAGQEAGKERESERAKEAVTQESWGPESHAEASEKKDAKESAHAEKEREEEGKAVVRPGGPKAKGEGPKTKGQEAKAKGQSDGFERAKNDGKGGLTHTGHTTGTQPAMTAQGIVPRAPVHAVSTAKPALAPPPSNRPPDAFQLLHQAQDKGVYFKEDGLGGGQEREDPELALAVEEAIRMLFGVRGILRVGPGKNMEDEPVVVVVASQGFGEAQLKVIPPAVHRFPTLLAIPFDLLPLKKER